VIAAHLLTLAVVLAIFTATLRMRGEARS